MAKFTSTTVPSGFNSAVTLAANFTELENQLNNKVLYRDNPTGEPNQMLNDLDMNSNDILNAESVNASALYLNGIKASLEPFNGTNIVKFYSSISGAVAATDLAIGDIIKVEGRPAMYKVVSAATGTADGGAYLDLTGITGQIEAQFVPGNIQLAQWEPVGNGTVDDTVLIQAALDYLSDGDTLYLGSKKYLVTTLVGTANSIKVIGSNSYINGSILYKASGTDNIITVQGFGWKFFDVGFEGTATGNVGQGTVSKGIEFLRGDGSKDIDSEVHHCTFTKLETSIKATGANLIVRENLFSTGNFGVDMYRNGTDEFRGFRISDNRFHSMGGVSTDAAVTNQVCVRFNDTGAFMNQITDNYADGCKRFFSGALGRGSSVNNNIISRSRGQAILVSTTNQAFSGGHVVGNVIDNYYTGDLAELTEGGIHISSAGQTVVANNTITHVRSDGIRVSNSSFCTITGNNVNNFNIYDGDTTTFSGNHDGADNASVLTDSGEAWTIGEFVGATITNVTDGSTGVITANTATTITATLSGGTDNDWDIGDAFTLDRNVYSGIYLDASSVFCNISGNTVRNNDRSLQGYASIYTAGSQNHFNDNTGSGSLHEFFIEPSTNKLAHGNTHVSLTGKRFDVRSAAPVEGRWLLGDVVWNSSPVAGGTVGWINVVGGTPGTWKTFGAITV